MGWLRQVVEGLRGNNSAGAAQVGWAALPVIIKETYWQWMPVER